MTPRRAAFAVFTALSLTALAGCGGGSSSSQAPKPTTEERLAAPADAAYGQKLFGQCAVCHAVSDDPRAVAARPAAPSLWGVYGREAASRDDFRYSPALKKSGIVWNDETLDEWISNPHKVVSSTMMSFPGEPNPANRRDIIAYLKTLHADESGAQ